MSKHKAYIILITLELGSIGIKYQALNTNNPFQQSTPICFLFLTSLFCHAVATMADTSFLTTRIIFHLSGVVGCETLLWILLPELWKWYIFNMFLLVVTSLCFLNFMMIMDNITKLFRGTLQNPNLEPQETPTSA
jgi:aspartate aminotransferase